MATRARTLNPLRHWQVDRGSIRTIGQDLQRPECILAERDGTLWSADARGGVMRIAADGTQTADRAARRSAVRAGRKPRSTSCAARCRTASRSRQRRHPDRELRHQRDRAHVARRPSARRCTPRSTGGRSARPIHLRDSRGRLWITVTTRLEPWTRSVTERTNDGYVALVDESGIRIVAEGFVGTNEVPLDANEEWLYVVESNARRISRLRVRPDGRSPIARSTDPPISAVCRTASRSMRSAICG